MKKFLVLAFVLALFAGSAFAGSPFFFKGYVHLNNSLAPNGTVVEAYIGGSSTPANAAIVGQGQLSDSRPGWYVISVVGNLGDSVTFRVNNLSLNSANGTNTSAQTLASLLTGGNGGSDQPPFNLSANKTSNGVSCLYAGGCTSGFCANSYCCDTACTASGYSCAVSGSVGTCTSTGSSSSSSSSGGGGGGSSGPATTTGSGTVASVSSGSTASVSITQSDTLGIQQIEVTVTNSVSNVQISVQETTSASAGVTSVISSSGGAVYKYLEITKTNIQNSDISSAKISFKVPKSWLTSNNIDKSTVALNRYNNGWSKLPTTIASEDSNYIYFSANSPGFSTFAVTGEKNQTAAASSCGNNTRESGEECDGTDLAGQTCVSKGYAGGTLRCTNCKFDTTGCTASSSSSSSGSSSSSSSSSSGGSATPPKITSDMLIIGIIVLIIIALGYVYYRHSKKNRIQRN